MKNKTLFLRGFYLIVVFSLPFTNLSLVTSPPQHPAPPGPHGGGGGGGGPHSAGAPGPLAGGPGPHGGGGGPHGAGAPGPSAGGPSIGDQ